LTGTVIAVPFGDAPERRECSEGNRVLDDATVHGERMGEVMPHTLERTVGGQPRVTWRRGRRFGR
jgi:hypothetical protein